MGLFADCGLRCARGSPFFCTTIGQKRVFRARCSAVTRLRKADGVADRSPITLVAANVRARFCRVWDSPVGRILPASRRVFFVTRTKPVPGVRV
jgi:hypothetical protein